MRFPLFCLLGALAVSGCDSGSDDPGTGPGTDPDVEVRSCTERGLQTATASLTTPQGAFQGVCSSTTLSDNQIRLQIENVSNATVDQNVELLIRNFTDGATGVVAGTYEISDDLDNDLDGNVTYRSGSTTVFAESGSITVTTITPTRIAGTFSFTSPTGAQYTNGRFDAPL